MPDLPRIIQDAQPPGVPPLEVTGERTLPDVPTENYWFQRHVKVFEWAAELVRGKTVIDMACGEGYGAAILAETAETVLGVDANPEAFEHARLKYVLPNVRFERVLMEEVDDRADVVTFLQTVEHVRQPESLLRHFKSLVGASLGVVVVSTPNVLTLAPPGARQSENPWHVHEFEPEEFASLLAEIFPIVELWGLYHCGALAGHTRVTPSLVDDLQLQGSVTTDDFLLARAGAPDDLVASQDLIAVCR